ncbi:hypothetical protein Tsubulata_022204 [Turnera subulata]|uniref:VOC domain-containing protein n=1 Tax=Turnera subulata TaxID=218843 RepID=A0A9Q0FUH1_9ROSI|nr:hypothetical protein Tsubulata_022204 [Turnera subulata]
MELLMVDDILVILRVPSVDEAVNFYKKAFGAVKSPLPSSPEMELLGIPTTKLDILPCFPILITDSPSVPEISRGALNLCLQVKGQPDDLQAAVSRAVNAGATTDGEVVFDGTSGRPSMRLDDPFGVVWFLYVPSDDEISSDYRRTLLYLDSLPANAKPEVSIEDLIQSGDPNPSYLSKVKILLKVPDPVAAVQSYKTAFRAEAPQFPTDNEIPHLNREFGRNTDKEMPHQNFTPLEFAQNYYILISGSAQNVDSGINLCARTYLVEELVRRLVQGGAVLEGDVKYDHPIFKFRRLARVRDQFGVLWFIYEPTLEEEFVLFVDFIKENDRYEAGPRRREAIRLREKAAREGRM